MDLSEINYSNYLLILMPLTAFLYASVGHGGASSYIMLLTLFHFDPFQIKSTALLLNMFVSAFAFIYFQKACKFPWKIFLLLSVASVPLSFLGGMLEIPAHWYRQMVGFLLIFAALRLYFKLPSTEKTMQSVPWYVLVISGALIGMISGMLGIGGGILLSPLLLFGGWASMKETAAVSALFIFVNSIAGFVGAGNYHVLADATFRLILPITVLGGILGAYFGANKFQLPYLKALLGMVLLVASLKFLFR